LQYNKSTDLIDYHGIGIASARVVPACVKGDTGGGGETFPRE